MSEATIVRRILQKLHTAYPDGVWYKIHTGPFQERGIPDIIGCLRGRFIAFEVKTPENKKGVTNYQKIQLNRIKSAEGKATVVTSVREAMDFMGKNFSNLRPITRLQTPSDVVESTVEEESDGKPTEDKSAEEPTTTEKPKQRSKRKKRDSKDRKKKKKSSAGSDKSSNKNKSV